MEKDFNLIENIVNVRNDEKQQTEKNLSHKRSFASLKMTSTGHSEQREESHKLDCFARPADGGNGTRNDGKEVFPRPSRLCRAKQLSIVLREGRARVRGKKFAKQTRKDLSALVPSKRIAFTKPSRGTSDSERRTIINGNRAFRFDCERCHLMRGAAFTLAEVLITLGIIGVVAAITMPILQTAYKRQVTETKLKKFYSVMNTALRRSVAENDDVAFHLDIWRDFESQEKEWLETNIIPYINVEFDGKILPTGNRAYKISFPDGTGFISSISNEGDPTIMFTFCMNASKCEPKGIYGELSDGRDTFLFYLDRSKKMISPAWIEDYDDSALKLRCYNTFPSTCAAVIYQNGWKIPKDYPWIK